MNDMNGRKYGPIAIAIAAAIGLLIAAYAVSDRRTSDAVSPDDRAAVQTACSSCDARHASLQRLQTVRN